MSTQVAYMHEEGALKTVSYSLKCALCFRVYFDIVSESAELPSMIHATLKLEFVLASVAEFSKFAWGVLFD